MYLRVLSSPSIFSRGTQRVKLYRCGILNKERVAMKKLTYVTPEIEYAIIANDILTESFDAGIESDVNGVPVMPDQSEQ